MAKNILEVRDLIISFKTTNGKVQAVRDISFDLQKGETLCIVGESGSGKSVTSRAILGILAGNAIVEGGSIVYNGQDLLQISEDDFHKIRGDKIAMIFQDPLSSLDPIVRIGKQLTEAMLLKNRASRRSARKEFNSMLACMRQSISEALKLQGSPDDAKVREMTETFDKFNIAGIKLENDYNEQNRRFIQLREDVDFYLLNYDKQQEYDFGPKAVAIAKQAKAVNHPFVVCGHDLAAMGDGIKAAASRKPDKEQMEKLIALMRKLGDACAEIAGRPEPNFFTLGYYKLKNPDADVFSRPVEQLNAETRKYLDETFMLDFIKHVSLGLKHSAENSNRLKQEVINEIDSLVPVFDCDAPVQKKCIAAAKRLSSMVEASIDRLAINKDSAAYTFAKSLNAAIDKYFGGVKNNPIAQKKYDRQKAKYDALIARGKNPDWKVTPAALVDLELAKNNMVNLLRNLRSRYVQQITDIGNVDFDAAAVDFIDYMKERASQVVNKVTRRMAKIKALKLMEEVGIPEPRKRYRQYPFEFSGGMRQRIVIAIALAANPDILICDEPTTALDVTIQSQILELINNLKRERQLSVIFITHDLGVVANMADRVAVMYAGKIVEYGLANDIFYKPAHPYTWALLSSMPDLDTKDKLEAIPGTPPNMIYPPKGDAFAPRNKYALQIDLELQPPMFKISDTHYAATWLLHPDAPKVEPPKAIREKMEKYAAMVKETQDGQQ